MKETFTVRSVRVFRSFRCNDKGEDRPGYHHRKICVLEFCVKKTL